jgi:hypothetical protein
MVSEHQNPLAHQGVERVTDLAADARGEASPRFARAVDHLDAARDHLVAAADLLTGFQSAEVVGVTGEALREEISQLALQSSLLADLLDGLIGAPP